MKRPVLKSKICSIRVSPEELEAFTAAAQKEGMSLAAWLRAVAMRESKFDRNERRLSNIEARLTMLEGRAA